MFPSIISQFKYLLTDDYTSSGSSCLDIKGHQLLALALALALAFVFAKRLEDQRLEDQPAVGTASGERESPTARH
jgi:hypothetical protein